MTNYYSQQGEDFVLDQIFDGKAQGFFVEVGCIDGLRFSNTLTFEERGWKGICIEAHADYIEALRKNRPGSIVLHCAAGEADQSDVAFYANSRGSLSSLDRGKEQYFKENYTEFFHGYQVQTVTKCRLDTVFDMHHVGEIDILSLDIEGYEVEAMRGLDLARYRPRVMVIEVDGKEQETALNALILPFGYCNSIRVGPNIFYVADPEMERRASDKVFHAEVIHTPHVLDGGDAKRHSVVIDTRRKSPGLIRRLLGRT